MPIAAFPGIFEKYFAAPHTFSFELAAGMFQIAYARVKTAKDFTDNYRGALGKKGVIIIEIEANRDENYKALQTLKNTIRAHMRGRPKK